MAHTHNAQPTLKKMSKNVVSRASAFLLIQNSRSILRMVDCVVLEEEIDPLYEPSENEVIEYFIANFLEDPRGYIKSFSVDNYTKWKHKKESLTYKFKEDVNALLDDVEAPYDKSFGDIFRASKGKHPNILKRFYANDISLETLVIFETCLGYVNDLTKVLVDPIWDDTKMRIVKYQPFLQVDCKKYRGVVLDVINTKL